MNPTSLHLLACHVPFVGGCFTLALLLWAIRRQEGILLRAADYAVIGVALGSSIAWASGPAALTALESWLDPAATGFAERHEGLGELAMIAWGLAAFLSLWGRFLERSSRPVPRWRTPALLLLVVAGVALAAWAGHEGGRIRHEELRHGADTALALDGIER